MQIKIFFFLVFPPREKYNTEIFLLMNGFLPF